MNTIQPGIYRHYKGNLYRVHSVVRHSENQEDHVLYEALYETGDGTKFFVRPYSMFIESVEYSGLTLPRFAFINNAIQTNSEEATANELTQLVKLLSLLQITKQQPLTGYIAAGIKLSELPTLAEHQYAAALSAFLIGNRIISLGGKLDATKIVIMLLIHDLGELFGGDISGPLHRVYPQLREHKDKIGECAIDLLNKFLDAKTKAEFVALHQEFETGDTDEKWVGKILDQIDHQFFLEHQHYRQRLTEEKHDYRHQFTQNHIHKLTERIKDPITQKYMIQFLNTFWSQFYEQGFVGLNELINS